MLDASFKKAPERQAARDLAAKYGAVFLAVECVAPDEDYQAAAGREEPGRVGIGRTLGDIRRYKKGL